MRDEQLRLEALHLKEEKEKKEVPIRTRTNIKYRKTATTSHMPSTTSKVSPKSIQVVQPMQMENNNNNNNHNAPKVRANNTTKLRSIAAHNIKNNNSNNTSSSTGLSASGKKDIFVLTQQLIPQRSFFKCVR